MCRGGKVVVKFEETVVLTWFPRTKPGLSLRKRGFPRTLLCFWGDWSCLCFVFFSADLIVVMFEETGD